MLSRLAALLPALALCLAVAPAVALGDPSDYNLSASQQAAFDELLPQIQAVAQGEEKRTDGLQVTYALRVSLDELAELGVSVGSAREFNNLSASDAADVAALLAMRSAADLSLVFEALLLDLPFELYWYDKSAGYELRLSSFRLGDASFGEDGTCSFAFEATFTVLLAVAQGYRADEDGYAVDQAMVAAAQEARQAALDIVARYAALGLSDYEVLVAYKDELCALASYNAAAAGEDVAYGDPWQVVWVFDGDEETGVVCEGYAKAFQYLCDLTSWSDEGTACHTVTGYMSSTAASGAHMWNVVTVDGVNYLVDVTNSDERAVGQGGGLFLALPSSICSTDEVYGSAEGLSEATYLFWLSDRLCNACYTYDVVATSLYRADVLALG